MMDYGEFVPQALKESSDSNLRALGEKLTLFDVDLEDDISDHYDEGLRRVSDESQALIETYSYLK